MYRYSRGQGQGQGLARPAWGSSGGGGTRSASPEPASFGPAASGLPPAPSAAPGTAAGGGDLPKERQDEVILQLENELIELRNACAWKDQRIAELSRADAPATRLKRDIRLLVAELHNTRKSLSESILELTESRSQLELLRESTGAGTSGAEVSPTRDSAGFTNGGVRDRAGSSSSVAAAAAERGSPMRERVSELTEENRQLRNTITQLKAAAQPHVLRQAHGSAGTGPAAPAGQGSDVSLPNGVATGGGGHILHPQPQQASGASTQRAFESRPATPGGIGSSAPAQAAAASALAGRAGHEWGHGYGRAMGDEAAGSVADTQQIVYSSAHPEHAATVGPSVLVGVGPVEGAAAMAQILLTKIPSSVMSAQWRANNQVTAPDPRL